MDLINKHLDQFNLYYQFLVSENEKYNLTSIVNKDEVFIKHFQDSLSLKEIFNLNESISVCDVGSGAGFPAIPLKICFPNIKLTIIEPTLKRINFLKNLAEKLEIDDIEFINARAEDLDDLYIEKFDITTARAVANMRVLLELLIKITKVDGHVVLYKGINALNEIKEASNALRKLDCSIDNIYDYELNDNLGKRYLIKIKKNKKTNSMYPRRYAEIKKKPL